MKRRIDDSIANSFLYRAGSSWYGDCKVTDNDKKRDLVKVLDRLPE
jgi:hypothetical protein